MDVSDDQKERKMETHVSNSPLDSEKSDGHKMVSEEEEEGFGSL